MIVQVDKAVLGIQAASVGRTLYGLDHVVPRQHVDRSVRALGAVIAERQAPVRLVRLDERLHFGDEELPSSSQLAEALLPRLAAHGIEWIEFRAGLSAEEMIAFLEQLDRVDPDFTAAGTAHVLVGQIGRSSPRQGAGGAARSCNEIPGLEGEDPAGQLKQVWERLKQGARPDRRLTDLVESIRLATAISTDVCKLLADVKSHDEYTFVHTVNVAILSAALGEAVGMNTNHVFDLTLAALLHDVGKQHTSLAVLNKPGKLDDAERRHIERHTTDGAAILLACRGVPDVAPIVAYEHHANVDGSGYPKLAAGGRPHLASQIVHVADVFDALRTNRPYRTALEEATVRKIITQESGKSFEPALVNLFLDRVVRRPGSERAAA
jgi:putative nucleotidyltransferase with HDIG domain